MCKLFTIVTSVLISSPAFAAPSACLEGIEYWEELMHDLTPKQLECIELSHKAKISLAGLCSTDRREFSDMYVTYLHHQVAHIDASYALKVAKDEESRAAAHSNIQRVDQNWSAVGFKNEVRTLLWALVQAKDSCKSL
jgi:hypothetical protein